MNRSIPLCAILLALGTPRASAILDTNGNGLSDVWERTHNDGSLFLPKIYPPDDEDGDGWTNAEEAAAGTDPFDSNPPDGILRPETTRIPEHWEDTNSDGIDELVPEAMTLVWVGVPGKQYTLLTSTELVEQSWLPFDAPFLGNGNEITYCVYFSDSEKAFWRVAVTDIDTDGDGLTDAEENALATDPALADSDNDNLNDQSEILQGTNPNNPDTDGDGSSDGDEVKSGHDPTSNQSYPPVWVHTQRHSFHGLAYIESSCDWNVNGTVSYLWSPTISAPETCATFLATDCPFPALPPDNNSHFAYDDGFAPHLVESTGERPHPGYGTQLNQSRFWLKTKPAPEGDVKINVLRVTHRKIIEANNSETILTSSSEPLDVLIHAGQILSNPIDAPPTFTQALEDGKKEYVVTTLAPVELITDMNNDGKINFADNQLRDAALAGGASDDAKDRGTEFMFHNDLLSNGIWDKEDSDPNKPLTAKNDDDTQEIRILVGITEGDVWLDHPAIAGLSFYKTRECNPSEKVNLSPNQRFTVSGSNPFPDKIFIRADGLVTYPVDNPQIEGDLVLNIIPNGTSGEQTQAAKLRLTLVNALGAKKYFHAARDYMFENNSRICVRREEVGNPADPSIKRFVTMLHEKTEMKVVDSFRRDRKLYGIDAIIAEFPNYEIAVNGNFCYYTSILSDRPSRNAMTDKCHGRLITSGGIGASSSIGGSSPFESVIADYIGWNAQTGVDVRTGEVPVTPMTYTEALGGFGSNISLYSWHPWYGIANAGDKKVLFVATPYTIAGNGAGGGASMKQKLASSGCPALPGGQAGEIQCIYGDGGSSLALAYKVTGSNLAVRLKGEKHFLSTASGPFRNRGDYFINTYILFKSQNPR